MELERQENILIIGHQVSIARVLNRDSNIQVQHCSRPFYVACKKASFL